MLVVIRELVVVTLLVSGEVGVAVVEDIVRVDDTLVVDFDEVDEQGKHCE